MEDTLIWWLNTSRNLELILRTANPIEIMISNVNHHALPNPKYGESQTMVLIDYKYNIKNII